MLMRREASLRTASELEASAPRVSDLLPDPVDEVVETESGRYFHRRTAVPIEHVHGRKPLASIRSVCPGRLSRLARDPRLEGVDFGKALYFDIETSSLEMGAGVCVFLVGFGLIEGDQVVVHQLFARHPGEEGAMLARLNGYFERASGAVSFFGKNFDKVRVEDKMLFHRIFSSFPAERHLDLCHVSRSIFRERFSNCRLKTLEKHELGFRRVGDLPGAECPQAYFDYVRSGVFEGDILRVFEHNLYDVLSLITLTARLDQVVVAPRDIGERHALARVLQMGGEKVEAQRLWESVIADPDVERFAMACEARRQLSLLYRSAGDARAVALWKRMLDDDPLDLFAPLELAKWFEHKDRDFPRALKVVEMLCERITGGRQGEELQRRRERLRTKLQQ
ncbi:MAG: ribonuclease H-like domain-containing protein [Planctomycetota bacterium]